VKSELEKQSDARIMKLFRGRCVVCMSQATQIHELITRARSKQAIELPQNRVPLCSHDHDIAHHDGYTGSKEDYLRGKAIERLIMYGENLNAW